MKKFFYVGTSLVVLAIGATVVVWYLLQQTLTTPSQTADTTTSSNTVESVQPVEISETSISATPTPVAEPAPPPVPELNEQQRQAAEAVGINIDEITLTPAMIVCAEEKMSRERMLEIAEGDAPTFFEALALVPCVKAE